MTMLDVFEQLSLSHVWMTMIEVVFEQLLLGSKDLGFMYLES